MPAIDVLSGERGETRPLDSALLATMLFLSAGVTRVAGPPSRRIYFRAAMSAGNLHPIELYVVVAEGGVDGLDAGVFHFSPLEVTLTPLRRGDHRSSLGVDGPLAIVLTGIPWRTAWKYGERGWRHLYWDGGTMLANLLAVADSHGMDHRTLLGFDDDAIEGLLGVDGKDEMPLAMVEIGTAGRAASPPSTPDVGPLAVDVSPVAPAPIRLPLLEQAQAGSTLAVHDVEAWREAGSDVARSAPSQIPSAHEPEDPIEEVITSRGSTRKMLRRSVPGEDLDWPMAAATRAAGIDAVPDGTLLSHYVNVHAVEGRGSGAYRHMDAGVELIRSVDSPREASTSLCLGQPLGGDAAYTVFHCAELDAIVEALGSRGYRVAQLEAGVVSGRLALCAFALGLGATGLTFFDDPVSRFFETSAEPMLVTAVGVAATAPAPAGAPGAPAVLHR